MAAESVVAHHFADSEQQSSAAALGMWVFLATEVLIFGALFTGYAVYRYRDPPAFEAASGRLMVLVGAVNTVVLLASSLTMALSVHYARIDQRHALVLCLILTILLGVVFLAIKAYEYHGDWRENLVPGTSHFLPEEWSGRTPPVHPQHVQLFLLFYYVMTGLHAVHLTVGCAWMTVVALLAWRGLYSPHYYAPVEVAGLYWHFVDIAWIFLFPLLYLTSTHTLADFHF